MSTYIFNQAPLKYGSQQEDYREKTQQAIKWGIHQIKEVPKDEQSLIQLFFHLIEHFSQVRNSIARAHQTDSAEQFGIRRDTGEARFYFTHLDVCEYKEYDKRIITLLADKLSPLHLAKKDEFQKKLTFTDKEANKLSCIEIELLELEDLIKLKWTQIPCAQDLPIEFPTHLFEKLVKRTVLSEGETLQLKAAIKDLKIQHIDLYKRFKMAVYFQELKTAFPSLITNLESFFALTTTRLEVDGKMYAVSQYLTWLQRDSDVQPVQRMLTCSSIIIFHQDIFLIDTTLKEMALIFAKVILENQNKENLSQLKNDVAILRHYGAHCMPWQRGSASIMEMMECAMYGSFDLDVTYNPKKQIDLESFAFPLLSDFIKAYGDALKLAPKPSSVFLLNDDAS